MPADPRTIAEEALRLAEGATPGNFLGPLLLDQATLARAYLALLPPAGAWSHDEGDVVLTHPDGSTERFYAGERAPFIVAACSRHEALLRDLPVVIEAAEERAEEWEDQIDEDNYDPADGTIDEDSAIAQQNSKAIRAAIERLRALGGG